MSPLDSHLPRLVDVSLTPGSAPEVKWIPPETSAHRAPLALHAANSPRGERSERVNAMTVAVLSLCCTLLAVLDLFLLASGA